LLHFLPPLKQMSVMSPRLTLCAFLAGLCLLSHPALAQVITFTWTGNSTSNGLISDTLNWGGTAPTGVSGNENLVFGASGAQTNVLVPSGSYASLTFNTGRPAYTFSGSGATPVLTIAAAGGVTVNSGATVTFNSSLGLNLAAGVLTGDDHVFNIAAATTLQINSVISGTGHFSKVGSGTLILTGANTFNYNGGLGFLNSSSIRAGTVTLNGGSINHGTTGDIWVGQFNGDNGTLNLTSGGLASGYYGVLGHDAGSTGTATVSGSGSTWTNSNGMSVGSSGTGTLTVSNGGAVSVTGPNSYIAANAGSTGTATIDGSGSTWTNASGLNVGNSGNGTLNITNGADVTNTYSYIATQSGSSGTVSVDGTGSTWTNSGLLAVGQGGSGTLTVSNGGAISSTEGYLGYASGSTGTGTVTGLGSEWTTSNNLVVGSAGTGSLTLAASGTVNVNAGSGQVRLGDSAGGTGTLNLGAAAANPAAAGGLVNAASITTGAGTGTVQFKTTGTNGTPYYLTKNGTAGGVAVAITGATNVLVNAGYNVLTGTNTYTGGTRVNSGTLVVSGAGSITHSAATTYVGYSSGDNGFFHIEGGADVVNHQGQIGLSGGSFGTAVVTGAGSTWSNSNYLYVGLAGTGTLNILNGAVVSSPNTSIGNNTTGTGVVLVDGAGSSFSNSATAYIGSQGDGTLEVRNNGSASAVTGSIGNNAGGFGLLEVHGNGAWTSGNLLVGNATNGALSVYSQGSVTSGSATIGVLADTYGSASVEGSGSTFHVTGNLVVGMSGGGDLYLANGGQTTAGGFVVVGDNAGGSGSILLNNPGTTLTVGGDLYVGNAGNGSLYAMGGSAVNVGSGSGNIRLGHTGGNGHVYLGTDGEGYASAPIINAASITTETGAGFLIFANTATKASPYYLTKDGTAGGTAVTINGGTVVQQVAGYNVINGANTYTGGTQISGGTLVAGSNTALGTGTVTVTNTGALSVAAGTVLANPITFTLGGTLTGTGTFGSAITAGTGIRIAPGASPGTLSFANGLTLASGGTLDFEVQSAAGPAGTGYDLVSVSGALLDITATSGSPFTIMVRSLNGAGNPGNVADFSSGSDYSWTIAASALGINGFAADKFVIDTSLFTNSLGIGSFSLSQSGNNLLLNFTPVPEPSTYALMLSGLALAGLQWRRRRAVGRDR
jgi:T5SS/PEP-CTERM-associated repeat protein/autotransporter-associated beta strand protein